MDKQKKNKDIEVVDSALIANTEEEKSMDKVEKCVKNNVSEK